jgi:hypothetical protein
MNYNRQSHVGMTIIRTALEEELPGYKEFARMTRYRLIPGIE